MSSDRKEPGSGKKPGNAPDESTSWKQPPDYPQTSNEGNTSFSPIGLQGQDAAAFSGGNYLDQDEEEEYSRNSRRSTRQRPGAAHTVEPMAILTWGTDLYHRARHYVAFIIVPLLFAGISCLFTLPRVAAGQAALPPAGFWPLLILFLVVMVAQGIAAYFASHDLGLRLLSISAGFAVFLLIVIFTVYGRVPGIILLAVFLILGIYITRGQLYTVPDGFVDITYHRGKYIRTIYPGLTILLPWERVKKQLNTQEVQWTSSRQIVQLSRDEDVRLRAVISYQLVPEDAYLAITQVRNWEESLHTLLEATVQEAAVNLTPDDFIVWGQLVGAQAVDADEGQQRRNQISQYIQQSISDRVAPWGVQVNRVTLIDIALLPRDIALMEEQQVAAEKQLPPDSHLNTQEILEAGEPTEPAIAVGLRKTPAEPVAGTSPDTGKVAQRTPPSTPAPTPHTAPTPRIIEPPTPAPRTGAGEGNRVNEEVLVNAYKAVQNNKITDPETIRSIATEFDAIGRDPVASQNVSFDAARAALNLLEQAAINERLQQAVANEQSEKNYANVAAATAPASTPQPLPPDWLSRQPGDDNLTSGG